MSNLQIGQIYEYLNWVKYGINDEKFQITPAQQEAAQLGTLEVEIKLNPNFLFLPSVYYIDPVIVW